MPTQLLQNQPVTYTVKNSRRARRMRIAVYCDSSLVVTVPYGMSQGAAERFVKQKTGWIIDKLEYFRRFKGRVIVKSTKRDYLKYKSQALAMITERINYFNQLYNFSVNKINIRNQKTRWGSCSKKGNLNFNYKLALLPQHVADYVIVHELCHLGEFNHSRRFWSLVARAVPNYREIKRELREKGLGGY